MSLVKTTQCKICKLELPWDHQVFDPVQCWFIKYIYLVPKKKKSLVIVSDTPTI